MYKRYLSFINIIIVKLFFSSSTQGYKYPLNYLGKKVQDFTFKRHIIQHKNQFNTPFLYKITYFTIGGSSNPPKENFL
jgi:hypothetical protein